MNQPNNRDRAAHVRRLAAAWGAELAIMGRQPRKARSSRPWHEIASAVAGATMLADAIDGTSRTPNELAAVLRRLGLSFAAVGRELGISLHTAKAVARRARLGGAA